MNQAASIIVLLSWGRWLLAVIAALLILSIPGAAQNAAGRVIGTVTDQQGAPIPQAKVTVTNVGTNVHWETVTDADNGTYQVLNLPIGNYSVTVEQEGFTKVTTDAQPLTINQSLRIDVHMNVGRVSEVVSVLAQTGQVETVNPTVGGTVIGETVQNLPLNGRDTLDLALTQPGVTPSAGTPLVGVIPIGEFSVAGGRDDSVMYLLDGGDNTSSIFGAPVMNPNPDAIAEFRILDSNYTAEYGHSAGGVVSVVTKSGTNEWHGSAFDYLRNDALNANTFFNNEAGQPRPVLKRNQFGGTVGGPIIRDRAFFFFAYQGQRQNSITVGSELTVYTPAELSGDFSRSALDSNGNPIPDPGVVAFLQTHPYFVPSGGSAQNGIIDSAKINPVAQAYIKAGLVPSSPDGIIVPNGTATDNREEYSGKFDFNATQKDHIVLTLAKFHNPVEIPFVSSGAPNVPGFPGVSKTDTYLGTAAYTRTISQTALNELRVTAQRWYFLLNSPGRQLPGPATFGINNTSGPTAGPVEILLNASGPQLGFSVNGPGIDADTTYEFSDTLTWVKGRHVWKAGGSLAIVQSNGTAATVNGMFNFNGPAGIGSGNDRADFLLGIPNNYQQIPNGGAATRSHQYAGFLQDEWKVAPRLVLTLGVRYEYSTPKLDPEHRLYMIMPGLQSTTYPNAPLGLVFPGDPGAPPHGSYFSDKKDWAPRFGFAWDPFGNGKTSLRGGFGVFYDTLLGGDNFLQGATPPFAAGAFLQFVPSNIPANGPIPFLSYPFQNACAGFDQNGNCTAYGVPYPVSYPIPRNLNFVTAGFIPFGASSFFIDPHMVSPYTYQYNLTLKRQLGKSLSAEIGYVGNTSRKLTTQVDEDPIILGLTTRVLNAQPGLQIPNAFAQCVGNSNADDANYSGLLTSLTKRMGDWHSIGPSFFTLSYTLSHEIDDASGLFRNTSQVPAYNHHQFRTSGDSDIRSRLVFSGGWELPFAHLWSSGPKRLTSGWNLYPIVSVQSGLPMDVNAGLPVDGTPGPSGAGDQNLVRPDLLTKTVPIVDPHQGTYTFADGTSHTGNYWFDPTVLGPPSPGTYGTLPRNDIRGPRRVDFDLSLEKETQLIENRLQIKFRAEFFNVLNHTQWQNPIAGPVSVFSPQLGQITSTFDPRIGQLALRFTF
jgi:hypothetical protein